VKVNPQLIYIFLLIYVNSRVPTRKVCFTIHQLKKIIFAGNSIITPILESIQVLHFNQAINKIEVIRAQNEEVEKINFKIFDF
jgi:hypothetical protein